jgi:site-specific recombinase XerD
MRNYIAPSANRAGIAKTVSWHIFRHTFSTLLVGNGGDVKTAQSLMRHANPNITMALYTHPVNSKKREAQTKVVEMIRPGETAPVAVMARGTA